MDKMKHMVRSTALLDEFITRVELTSNILLNDVIMSCFREGQMYDAIVQLLEIHQRVLRLYDLASNDLKNRYYQNLNDASLKLYTMINIYNALAYHSISVKHLPILLNSETISIKDTLVAITNEDEIDLFKKTYFKEPIAMNGNFNVHSYNEGILYQGVLTNKQAIYHTHKDTKRVSDWAGLKAEELIDSRRYGVNTSNLKFLFNYGRIRTEMYNNEQQIVPYHNEEETTRDEIQKVINYINKEYDLKKVNKKSK